MAYTTDWVMADGSDPKIAPSSFVHSFAWVSDELSSTDTPEDEERGRLLMCLNPDGSDGIDRYVYMDIPFKTFKLLRDVAYDSDRSLGSAYNKNIKHNPEVDDAVALSDVESGEVDSGELVA